MGVLSVAVANEETAGRIVTAGLCGRGGQGTAKMVGVLQGLSESPVHPFGGGGRQSLEVSKLVCALYVLSCQEVRQTPALPSLDREGVL